MKRIFFLAVFVTSQAFSAIFNPEDIENLKHRFFANIHPNGAIVASPSRQNPDYYYDWVRDSAIAMSLIESWYESSHAEEYKDRLFHYASWTKMIQNQKDPIPGQDILGEPKFYIDGSPFDGPWGRPQNDGPALRASVLIRFAQTLLNQHEQEYVETHLYNSSMDPRSMSVIKKDLEYTAHHWSDSNFDLWEEIFGHHFFTTMVQKKALMEGAALARRLNDSQAAAYYEKQADLMNSRLYQHIDQQNQLIQATLAPHSGPQKTLELDASVLLGILLNPQKNGVFAPNATYVQNTVNALHQQFNLMFPINNHGSGAILFGRYPGDTYDGYHTDSQGNPWFILTATMAEYYFTLADNLPKIPATQAEREKYIKTGDDYLKLIKKYAPDLNLSEQINLNSGIQQGAVSLTWSYVATLRALSLRERL